MEIQICQISVRDLIEGLCQQVGLGIWLDMATRSQNQGILGHPRAIRMILLHGESCNFSTTLPNMAAGGKAYASRSSPDRLSTSTAEARGSGTGDTNRGNLLLNLVAKWSILGRCDSCHGIMVLSFHLKSWHMLHIVWKTSEGETTLFGWSGLAWKACLLPHSADLECVGLSDLLVFWYTRSRFSIVGHKVGPTSCLLAYV